MNFRLVRIDFIATLITTLLTLMIACQPSFSQQGILDYDGNIIVPLKFGEIRKAGDDKYLLLKDKPVSIYTGMIGIERRNTDLKHLMETATLIDRDGKVLNNPEEKIEAARKIGILTSGLEKKYKHIQYAGADYRIVQHPDSKLFGAIDLKEKVLIPFQFTNLAYLGEDMYLAYTGKSPSTNRRVFLYHNGEKVKELPNWINTHNRFNKGLARLINKENAVLTKNGDIKYGVESDSEIIASSKQPDSKKFKIVEKSFAGSRSKKFGLQDCEGNSILPKEYSAIRNQEGDYLVLFKDGQISLFDTQLKKLIQLPNSVRNVQSNPIRRGVPIACTFSTDSETAINYNRLKWGFCDSDGNIVIKPKFRMATIFFDGKAVVGVSKLFENDLLFGIIDTTGAWLVKPKYKKLYKIGKNRLLAELPGDDDDVLEQWHNRPDSKLFSVLLNRYDFIDMPTEKLIEILGRPNIPITTNVRTTDGTSYIRYGMNGGCTGSNLLCFQISAANKITGWSYYWSDLGGNSTPAWIRENVAVIDTNLPREPGNLVPKSELAKIRKALKDLE